MTSPFSDLIPAHSGGSPAPNDDPFADLVPRVSGPIRMAPVVVRPPAPGPSVLDKLGEDLSHELGPHNQFVEHPFQTAGRTVVGAFTAPLESGATLGRYAGQKARQVEGLPPVENPVSGRDAALAGTQLATLAAAGPLEEAIGPAAAPLVGSRVAGAASRAIPGALVGAAYNPEHPVAGAVGGAALAAGLNELAPSRPHVFGYVTRDAERMLPEEATPRKVTATGRITETPAAPAEPDFTVEPLDAKNPFADLVPREEAPTSPAAPPEPAKAPSVEQQPETPTAPQPRATATPNPAPAPQPAPNLQRTPVAPASVGALAGTHVTDENGAPRTVYHGTSNAFGEFDGSKSDPNALYGPGFYFTQSPEVASEYTKKGKGGAPNVRPVRLDIKKPFDIDDVYGYDDKDVQHLLTTARRVMPKVDWDYADDLLAEREATHNIDGRDVYSVMSKMVDEEGKEAKRAGMNQILKAAGYDGITHIGGKDVKHRVWIAFDKSQIHSALQEPAPSLQPTKVRRKPVEGAVNPKYRLDDNESLLDRAAELEARLEEYSSGAHGSPEFVRDAEDLTKPITGNTSVKQRLAQDADLYHGVLDELKARGLDDDAIEEGLAKRGRTPFAGASATDEDVPFERPAPGGAIHFERSRGGGRARPTEEGPDLFGEGGGGAKQESLFGGKQGTESARNLSETERAAQSELDKLRQQLPLAKDAATKQKLSGRIAELERLVNRGQKITPEELSTRAAAGEGEQRTFFEKARGSRGAKATAAAMPVGSAAGAPPSGPRAVPPASAHPLPEAPGLEQHRVAIRPLEIVRTVKSLLNPESLGSDARGAAGTIGHEAAKSWRNLAIAGEALRDFGRYVGRLSKADAVRYWDAAEHGRSTGDARADQGNALLHQITEQYTQELVRLDRLKANATIANYIGRFWATKKTPVRDALSILVGRRPFEGPKSFLKQRTLVNFVDGLDAGLVPQTYNYVDAQLAKIAEMQRVIAAEKMLRQEAEFGRAKKVMTALGEGVPVDAEGEPWVRIDREGNDPAFTIYLPPETTHWEAVDTIVFGKLQALVKQLGVLHRRPLKLGMQALGYARGDREIATRFGGAEGVLAHELGHILDNRYGLARQIKDAIGKAPRRTVQKGKKAGQSVPDYTNEPKEARTRRKDLNEELRALANLRRETMKGVPTSKQLDATDRKYLHSWPEKMANMVEAYIHARPRFKQVAPGIFEIFDKVVEQHPELHPLRDIQPSLAREEHTTTERLPGFPIGGHWYAPRNAAAVWRNHLSRGLRGNPLFDAYMAPAQAASQLMLGLSGFHATVISTEGAFSELALAADNLINKGAPAPALRHVGTAGVSPAVTANLGRQVMQEYRRPGTHPELAKVLDAMIAGGYRGKATSEFWTGERIERFRNALEQTLHNDSQARRLWNASKLPFDAVWAAVETTTLPVLGKFVPFMKTGATYTAAAEKLATLTANGTKDVPLDVLRREMRDLVKEMDFRFGQVDYDNFFINNAVKNLAQMVFLAPGWTFGTVTLAERGLADIAKIPKRIAQRAAYRQLQSGPNPPTEPPPELLGKSAAYWIFGAVLGTMAINGTLTYLHTGERPKGKDFWAFRDGTLDRDGNPNRQTIPGYLMKDIYGWSQHPVETFRNKLSPILAFIGRLAVNRTYNGDEIYDEQASVPTKLKQVGGQLLKETAPLSVQNYLESRRRGESIGNSAERNVFGITPAKREFQRTPAQNLMNDILARRGHTARTPEEVEQSNERRQLREDVRSGTKTRSDLKAAEDAGELTRGQRATMLRTVKEPPLVTKFKQLRPDEAEAVWSKAQPWERELWNKVYRYKDRQYQRAQQRIRKVGGP